MDKATRSLIADLNEELKSLKNKNMALEKENLSLRETILTYKNTSRLNHIREGFEIGIKKPEMLYEPGC